VSEAGGEKLMTLLTPESWDCEVAGELRGSTSQERVIEESCLEREL
jgi:hypothetical protein